MKMMKTSVYVLIAGCLVAGRINSQSVAAWEGKKCAVVLTYDDAMDDHLDNVAPVLDSLGLKATFYITAFSPSMQKRPGDWKNLAANGHELGNHTLYHPCVGGKGREWVKPEYDLAKYSVQRMADEMKMTNLFLKLLDGKDKRTFAFTCGDMTIGDSSFILGLKNDFVAARGVRNQMRQISEVDLYNIDCYGVNHHTAAQMIEWTKQAMESKSLLVILFHGVGGGNTSSVDNAEHKKFLAYLKTNEKDLLIAPMLDVAEHIAKWQKSNKTH